MRKASRAKAIIELAVPVPLDNIDNQAPSHEDTFDIGPVSSPEDTPEEPEPLNEEDVPVCPPYDCPQQTRPNYVL